MPELKIEFHPDAIEEAERAQLWYAEKNKTASKAFVAELTHSISKISEAPERWPQYQKETRRYYFPRFPFSLIYKVSSERLIILAVMHHRRKPGYWTERN